jgi:FMN reductase
MRPLFGFFQALTLPLGIFANEGDFEDYRISSDELRERIETAVDRTVPFVRSRLEPLVPAGDVARPAVF